MGRLVRRTVSRYLLLTVRHGAHGRCPLQTLSRLLDKAERERERERQRERESERERQRKRERLSVRE